MQRGKSKTAQILAVFIMVLALTWSGCAKKEEPKTPLQDWRYFCDHRPGIVSG